MCLCILYHPIFISFIYHKITHHNPFLAYAATIVGALVGAAIGSAVVGAVAGAIFVAVCIACYRKKKKKVRKLDFIREYTYVLIVVQTVKHTHLDTKSAFKLDHNYVYILHAPLPYIDTSSC